LSDRDKGNELQMEEEEEAIQLRAKHELNEDREDEKRAFELIAFMEVPVNRLLSSLASYLVFVALVILSEANPSDVPNKVSVSWYHVAVAMFAAGNLAADACGMWRRVGAATSRGLSLARAVPRAIGSYSRMCRLTGHVLLLAGMAVEACGYLWEKRLVEKNGRGLRSPPDALCPIDDPTSYTHYHPVKVGICMQGVGFTLIVAHSLHYFR